MKKQLTALIDGRNMTNVEIFEAIYENRGVENPHDFLYPTEDMMIPYEDLKNINKAFNVVADALSADKSFLVYADCDVDGCTSGAIMYRYLKNFTSKVDITVNTGKIHGVEPYDVSDCADDIVIVVDSINMASVYDTWINAGKKVIVLDHHMIPEPIENYSKITLVSSANDYKNPHLSGAGVTWKFCKYCDEMFLTDYAEQYADLAATGIIADMCDMGVPENRYICNKGLRNVKNLGIIKANGGTYYPATNVLFSVAPLVNACQRLNENELALNLFLTDNADEVADIVKKMKSLKTRQAKLVDEIINTLPPANDDKVLVFEIDTEYGLSGYIGNKLLNMYQRPILVLKKDGNQYIGSMRACGVDNFAEMCNKTGLAECRGHENASGVFIDVDNYDKFIAEINAAMKDVELENRCVADVQLDISQVTTQFIADCRTLGFVSGMGFKPVTVLVTDINNYDVGTMSKGKHLKLMADDLMVCQWNYTGGWTEFDDKPSVSVVGTVNRMCCGKTVYDQIVIDEYEVVR